MCSVYCLIILCRPFTLFTQPILLLLSSCMPFVKKNLMWWLFPCSNGLLPYFTLTWHGTRLLSPYFLIIRIKVNFFFERASLSVVHTHEEKNSKLLFSTLSLCSVVSAFFVSLWLKHTHAQQSNSIHQQPNCQVWSTPNCFSCVLRYTIIAHITVITCNRKKETSRLPCLGV